MGNSGKLEVLKMPNLLRVEGSFRVEANRDPHPLPLAKYNDFKIRVVEAPKLTYANRVTVYDTPELETLKLDALKYGTRLGRSGRHHTARHPCLRPAPLATGTRASSSRSTRTRSSPR